MQCAGADAEKCIKDMDPAPGPKEQVRRQDTETVLGGKAQPGVQF